MNNAKKKGLMGLICSLVVAAAGAFSISTIAKGQFIKNGALGEIDPYTLTFNTPLEGVQPCGDTELGVHDYFKAGVGRLGANAAGVEFQLRSWSPVSDGVVKINTKDEYNFGNETPINGMFKIEGKITGTANLSYGMGAWNRPFKEQVSGDFCITSDFEFTHFAFDATGVNAEFTINSLKISYSCVDAGYRGTACVDNKWEEFNNLNITNDTFAIDVKILKDNGQSLAFDFGWEYKDGTPASGDSTYNFHTSNFTWFWSGAHNEQYSGVKYLGKTSDGYDRIAFKLSNMIFGDNDIWRGEREGNCGKIPYIKLRGDSKVSVMVDIIKDIFIPWNQNAFTAGSNFDIKDTSLTSCSSVEFKYHITSMPAEGAKKFTFMLFNDSNWDNSYGYFDFVIDNPIEYAGVTVTKIDDDWNKVTFDFDSITQIRGNVEGMLVNHFYIHGGWTTVNGIIADFQFIA